jgi:hypothetical protein
MKESNKKFFIFFFINLNFKCKKKMSKMLNSNSCVSIGLSSFDNNVIDQLILNFRVDFF